MSDVSNFGRICIGFVSDLTESDLTDGCRVGFVSDVYQICVGIVRLVSDPYRIRVRGEAAQCWSNYINANGQGDATKIRHKDDMTQHKYNTNTTRHNTNMTKSEVLDDENMLP